MTTTIEIGFMFCVVILLVTATVCFTWYKVTEIKCSTYLPYEEADEEVRH